MTTQAEMSMCLIVKNEEKTLEKCLQSIRPYVKEIIVVDTGSTDSSPEIAKKYADKWELFTDCNDEEGIYDFSMARNRSFELASYDITAWGDCDDEIVGAENFHKYVEKYKNTETPFFIQFPYEYAYDDKGNCTLVHYRERLFFKSSAFSWVNGVHEVRIPKQNQIVSCDTQDDIIWKHRRQFVNKVIAPNRNLRILKKWYEKNGDSDARQLYYLGLEYGNVGDLESSKKMLNRYLELSGWDDEKYMALLRVIDYDLYENNHLAAINHALEAIKIKEDWGEAYFILAKCHYFLANSGKDEIKNWNKCINFARIGLSLPPTKTLLFINPNERNIEIHRYLNVALSKVGRIQEAIDIVNMGLKHDPDHQELLVNKRAYENYMNRFNAIQCLENLTNAGELSVEHKNNVIKILNKEEINLISPKEQEITNNMANEETKKEFKQEWKPYHRPENYPRDFTREDQPVAIITPHSQAFGIPEAFVYDDLPLKMTDNQLQALVITVWKEYILHDEILSAISFLENAPNRVRHFPEVENILRKTKNMISWISNEEKYDIGNAAQDNNGNLLTTDMTPLTQDLAGSAAARFHWTLDRMTNKSETVCVFACVDGQETNRFGLKGFERVVGVDCCTNSINIANEKAKEFNTGAIHIKSYFDKAPEALNNEKFDTIVANDVYEHVLDPVKDLLLPARKVVKETGKMLLTTPFGCWYRGEVVLNMHPWLFRFQNESWNAERDRAHIIAPTVWTTAEHFRKASWYVRHCNFIPQWYPLVEGQGNVCVHAEATEPKNDNPKDIVIYMGDGLEYVSPHTMNISGIGGSELAVKQMSEVWAAAGHKVRVYAGCGKDNEGIYDGVEWRLTEKCHDLECDVFITSRQAHMLNDQYNIKAKLKCIWTHDLAPKSFNEEMNNKVDIIFALSNWHKSFILSQFPFIKEDKIIVSGNGIDFSRFDRQKDIVRNPHKAIVSSSPDRYLPSMLKIWPKVKEQVPDAELVIGYGFFNWEKSATLQGDTGQLRLIGELKQELKNMEPLGIKLLGRLNQWDLAREFLSAGVFVLPSWFAETNCISLSEGLSAGCAVVASDNAALGERILPQLGTKIQGDWVSEQYINDFADAVVKAMTNTTNEQRDRNQKYARENLPWDKFANQWIEIFNSKLDKKEVKKVFEIKKYIPLFDRK